MSIRVIPRLDIKGPNLVKGIHLEGLRVLGDPAAFARHYYENGADELLYVDTVASLYGRNSLLDFIATTSSQTFIPLTVTGGLRSVDDVRAALRAGADKVAINTAAIQRPALINEVSTTFGSSTLVVSIEAIRQPDGSHHAFVENGREATGRNVVDWAIEASERGAGEILLTSVDQEGTGKGYDVDLTKAVAEAVPIPVIACGGAGSAEDVAKVVRDGRADAVSLASILHYGVPEDVRRGGDHAEGNREFLLRGRAPSHLAPASIGDVKQTLRDSTIPVRSVA